METVIGTEVILASALIWLVFKLRRVEKGLSESIAKLKKSTEDTAVNHRHRMDEMAIQLHEVDIQTSRISEDRARVPIASRQSWTRFDTPIRDAVDKHPLGGA